METRIRPVENSFLKQRNLAFLDNAARKVLFSIMKHLRKGRIHFQEGPLHKTFGRLAHDAPLEASVTVLSPNFYSRIVFGGNVGAGEAYMLGLWQTDDLTQLMRIIVLNQNVFGGLDKGWARLSTPLYKLYHSLHRDTRKGSRTNIAAHYDLGNDFYRLFLDETLTYSCGIFENRNSTLKEASLAKYDRICKKLLLNPSDHVLEIGTGWGGFAIFAATHYGCRITTITISRKQYNLALKRVKDARLTDRIEILFKDYRDIKGQFDKLVSIEMIEAVGHQYLDTFFRACSARLKDDGIMLLQAITITDRVFETHKRGVDFIKRYIFPGSCIPSIATMNRSVACATDMKMDHLEDIAPHYARTLRTWRNRFFENIEQVRMLGYSDAFIRMWEYYLCYCEAGFQERYLGDVQIRLIKPMARPAPILPPLDPESGVTLI